MNVVDCKEYTPLINDNNFYCIAENIADFAEDHGWTVDELRVNNWSTASGGSGWVSGGQTFLQLHCNNIQLPMTYRFWFSNHSVNAINHPFYMISMVRDENRTYSTTGSQAHPISQNPENETQSRLRASFISFIGFSPIKQWVMGNSKWIMTVIQRDALYCGSTFFGIPDLLNQTSDKGHIFWKTGIGLYFNSGYIYPQYSSDWTSANNDNLYGPWSRQLAGNGSSYFGPNVNVGVRNYLGVNLQYVTNSGLASNDSGVGFLMNLLLKTQTWSNKRVIVTPLIYSHPDALKQFNPFAYMPIGIIRFAGLDIGQVLTYGSEEYKVFPFNSAYSPEGTSSVDRHCGWAVRIK